MGASSAAAIGAPTVVVGGMVAGTPGQGGAAWAVLQYLLGLRRLGCDVYLIEPVDAVEVPAEAAEYCARTMRRFGFDRQWALVPRLPGEPVGLTRSAIRSVAARTDILLNISGMLSDADLLEHIAVRAFVDLDPVFNQLWHQAEGVDMRLDAHSHFVTVADAIGREDGPIPDCGRDWLPTLPPVVLEEWPLARRLERRAVTTVGHWRSYGSIHHGGVQYGQKAHSLRPLIGLPRRTSVRFELAIGIHPDEVDDLAALRSNGWTLLDPALATSTPDEYRRFVQGSWAEFGVAKSGYVEADSGWFSDRSACYLASGRPVIAQDTGFGRRLPTDAGLFAFSTGEDVLSALEELDRDYDSHREAARSVAEDHLGSDLVLGSLLELSLIHI